MQPEVSSVNESTFDSKLFLRLDEASTGLYSCRLDDPIQAWWPNTVTLDVLYEYFICCLGGMMGCPFSTTGWVNQLTLNLWQSGKPGDFWCQASQIETLYHPVVERKSPRRDGCPQRDNQVEAGWNLGPLAPTGCFYDACLPEHSKLQGSRLKWLKPG